MTVEAVLEHLHRNADAARAIVGAAVEALPREFACSCGRALASAILTPRKRIPAATRERLGLLLGRYLD